MAPERTARTQAVRGRVPLRQAGPPRPALAHAHLPGQEARVRRTQEGGGFRKGNSRESNCHVIRVWLVAWIPNLRNGQHQTKDFRCHFSQLQVFGNQTPRKPTRRLTEVSAVHFIWPCSLWLRKCAREKAKLQNDRAPPGCQMFQKESGVSIGPSRVSAGLSRSRPQRRRLQPARVSLRGAQ